MKRRNKPITILMADDDPDDRILAREALEESNLPHHLNFVGDGQELIEYLDHQGQYAGRNRSPRPDIILLDLNMPRKDGREALKEIKANPGLRQIPIVVLTTSVAEKDIFRTYDLGVSSYITKPVTFDALVEVMKTLGKYWAEIVQLPPEKLNRE